MNSTRLKCRCLNLQWFRPSGGTDKEIIESWIFLIGYGMKRFGRLNRFLKKCPIPHFYVQRHFLYGILKKRYHRISNTIVSYVFNIRH